MGPLLLRPAPAGCTDLKSLLGGKGASLKELYPRRAWRSRRASRSRPSAAAYYLAHDRAWPEGLEAEVQENLPGWSAKPAGNFGGPDVPLLVSVRSGAAVSMPGMMDTLLNVGRGEIPGPGRVHQRRVRLLQQRAGTRLSPASSHRGTSGTAVTIQAMFPSEVSGVLFTRDPVRHDAIIC